MTLPTFLLAAADSKFVWLGGKRFAVPAVNERWSPPRVLGIVAVYTTLAVVLALVISLAKAGQPWGWLVWLLGFFAACQSSVMASLMALCWNQRVVRLKQNPDLSLGLRPLQFRFGRWALGLVYFFLLGVVTPLAMVVTVENVRGQMAWSQARARLSAQGERMTMREILGPEIPASENAGAARIFAPFFDYPRESVSRSRPEVTNAIARFKDAVMTPGDYLSEKPKRTAPRQPENMADWSAAYRKMLAQPKAEAPSWTATLKLPPPGDSTRDVLTCLAVGDSVVAEVCAAAALPRAQFPVHWDQGFGVLLQHLSNLKSVEINLKLRCAAHLAAGETDAAFADATNALNVAELLREEPTLIAQLVRIAGGAIATSTLWQGLVEHRWSDAQLAVFQDRLARVDYHAGMVLGFEGERACSTTGLDRLITNPSQLPVGEGGFSLHRLQILVPFGMLRQNQVAIANYYTQFLHELRALQTNGMQSGFAPLLQARVDREKIRWERMPYSPSTELLKRLVPATARAEAKAARGQTMNYLARTVCALERHRLAHGSYPETLAALVPALLPKPLLDPMNAKPFQYRRTDDGWFLLYSVGEDGKDDGGLFRAKEKGPFLDWPWPLPTRADEGSLF